MLPQALIWLSLLLAATTATQYECLPLYEEGLCVIDSIKYQPRGDPIAFPTGYGKYHFIYNPDAQRKSHIAIFDEALYEAMHRPASIWMNDVDMENLTLPPELLVGQFSENNISSVTVEAGQNYEIETLNLNYNNLKEISFVSHLVNLETLNLDCNQISTIPSSVFAPLIKLHHLYLGNNAFTSIPWTDLPKALILVDCYHGHVESVDFTDVSLPSLVYVNLMHNAIATINATALLRAAPRLEQAHLYNSEISEHEMKQINAKLTSNNITYDEHKEYVGGLCSQRRQ